MSLLKVPFLLRQCFWGWKTLTSPNPTLEQTDGPDISALLRATFLACARYLGPGMALMEALVIIAHRLARWAPEARHPLRAANNLSLTPSYILGWALLYAGTTTRAWCSHELGTFFALRRRILKDHRLVTTGPYSVVRHPSYATDLMRNVGMTICQFSSGSMWAVYRLDSTLLVVVWLLLYVFIPVILVARRITLEDKLLRRTFPKEWGFYSRRTPYRLVPYLY